MKVVFVTYSLSMGGAEQSLSVMANTWAAQGLDVEIIRLERTERPPFYDLNSGIQLVDLQCVGGAASLLQQTRQLCRVLKELRRTIAKSEADVLVSFLDWVNIVSILATRGLGIPIVFSERVDPRYAPTKTFWKILRPLVYLWGDALVVLSTGCLDAFSKKVRAKATVIPNPIPQDLPVIDLPQKRRVIGIGRLVPQKGFDRLIRAFALVADRHPEWELAIFGEGPERSALENLSSELKVTEKISLPGATPAPLEELLQSSVFVLSSRFEGFGRVLAEAMLCGLPVISFDCPSGPAEILRDGKDGFLVPNDDVPALAETLSSMIAEPANREEYGARAAARAADFDPVKISSDWEVVLKRVVRSSKGAP